MTVGPHTVRLGLASHGNVYTAAYIGLKEGFFKTRDLDVQLSYHGVSGVVDALDEAAIDMGFTVFPDNVMRWVSSPKTRAVVIASANARAVNERWLLAGIMTTREYLASNRAQVLSFMKGMLESVHLMWTDHEKGARYMVEDQGATRDIGIPQFRAVTAPLNLFRQVLGKMPQRMELTEEHIANALAFLSMVHGELRDVAPAVFYDSTVLEELGREGFVDRLWTANL